MNDATLERLQYPAGRLIRKAQLAADERRTLIDEIAALPAQLRAATEGLDDARLDTPYRPGGWTKRQVVHHLADSHVNAYVRFMLALTEDEPTIKPYDEKAWAELPYPRTAPIATSLQLLASLHARWTETLREVKDDQWSRSIIHPENGRMTLDALVHSYAWHCRHHLAHVKGTGH